MVKYNFRLPDKFILIFILVIPSRSSTSKRAPNQSQEEVVLKMWKEGFTINDGQLHSIEQQENREFLLLVARGLVFEYF